MIEKAGQEDMLGILRTIDECIKRGLESYIVNIFIPGFWLEHKLIKNVLEANGYGIFIEGNRKYIRHKRYE